MGKNCNVVGKCHVMAKRKKKTNLLPVCDVHGVDKKKFVVSIKSPADHPEKKQKYDISPNHACKLDLVLYFLI